MPATTKTVILDDRDGSELPDSTTATRLSLDGVDYAIYLSKANQAELAKVVADFTRHAVKPVAPIVKHGFTAAEVRAWAVSEGLATKTGKLTQEAYDLYRDSGAR